MTSKRKSYKPSAYSKKYQFYIEDDKTGQNISCQSPFKYIYAFLHKTFLQRFRYLRNKLVFIALKYRRYTPRQQGQHQEETIKLYYRDLVKPNLEHIRVTTRGWVWGAPITLIPSPTPPGWSD